MIVNRTELADLLGISMPTVTAWMGENPPLPYMEGGGKGKPFKFSNSIELFRVLRIAVLLYQAEYKTQIALIYFNICWPQLHNLHDFIKKVVSGVTIIICELTFSKD